MKFNVSQFNRASHQLQRTGFAAKGSSSLQAGSWVSLQEPVNPFSHDEALLLCEADENCWSVWIPGHGEATLDVGQFRM